MLHEIFIAFNHYFSQSLDFLHPTKFLGKFSVNSRCNRLFTRKRIDFRTIQLNSMYSKRSQISLLLLNLRDVKSSEIKIEENQKMVDM